MKINAMSDAWNSCILRVSVVKKQNLNRECENENQIFNEQPADGGKWLLKVCICSYLGTA